RQFSKEEEVDFNIRLHQQVDDFEELLLYKGIHVESIEKARLNRFFNADLAGVLITNLLKNAIVHSYEGGNVRITIMDEGFQIANTGVKRPLETEKMFARCYRSTENPTSTGLGLAVVKAIAQLHHASLTYRYRDGMHHF